MTAWTEEEAKTKWCPFARVLASETDDLTAAHHGPYNRVYIKADGFDTDGRTSRSPMIAQCLGSACMAWRQTDNKTWPSGPGKPERKPEPSGYCGLAGRPE